MSTPEWQHWNYDQRDPSSSTYLQLSKVQPTY
jgi:hypothetical protein